MSEVLGVAASVVGLASLTIQIVENIHRLREFYAAIKNAPENINSVLIELDLLSKVLAEYSSRRSAELSSSAQDEAILYCRNVLDLLISIVDELGTSRGQRKQPWANIRVAFQRRKLDGMLSKLERAKSTLVLAQLGYFHESGPVDVARTLVPTSVELRSGSAQTLRSGTFINVKDSVNIGIGTLIVLESQTKKSGRLQNATEIRFSFSPWFLNFAMAISVCRSEGKVQRSLTTYNLVPANAPIFQACASGDEVLVQKLIMRGSASPLDVTCTGVTPLHVAAAFCHPAICRQMLRHGADAYAFPWSNGFPETPLRLATYRSPPIFLHHQDATLSKYASSPQPTRSRMQNTIRVLTEEGAAEIDLFYESSMEFGMSDSLLHRWRGLAEDFKWLLSEQRINLTGIELQEFYFSIAFESCMYLDGEMISLAMDKLSDLSRLAREVIPQSGWTFLHGLLGHLWFMKHRWPTNLPLDAVERIVDVGADIHALDLLQRTPLMILAWQGLVCVYYRHLYWIEDKGYNYEFFKDVDVSKGHHARLLDQWLSFLETKKVNLSEYVEREKELGAERWMEMCEGGSAGVGAEAVKGEWFVRLVFEKSSTNSEYSIHLDYEVRERELQVPGAWDKGKE